MEKNSSRRWKHKVVFATAIVVGLVATFTVACIPRLGLADNLRDDRFPTPFTTLPTVGKVVHFRQEAFRWRDLWGGKTDLAKLSNWKAGLESRGIETYSGPLGNAYVEPWPEEFADYPRKIDLPGSFCDVGDRIFEAATKSGGRYYSLRVNMTNGTFLLEGFIEDEG